VDKIERYLEVNKRMISAYHEVLLKFGRLITDQMPMLMKSIDDGNVGDRMAKSAVVIFESVPDEKMEELRQCTAELGDIVKTMSLDEYRIAVSQFMMESVGPAIEAHLRDI